MYNSTWMNNFGYSQYAWWTLSSRIYSNNVFIVNANSYIEGFYTNNLSIGARPVVYLNSKLKLSGSGTKSDPYRIS